MCTLQVRLSTSGIIIHYIGWGQSPNLRKYIILDGNFVFDLRDFVSRTVFWERNPGVKRDLPLSGTGT
jgi:hypothetical protein